MSVPLAGGNNITRVPVVGEGGTMNAIWVRWFNDAQTRIQNGLDAIGSFIGNISAAAKVGDRTEGIGTTLNHILATGKLDSLTSVSADVDTDHIADGTGHPLAGGAAAYAALVQSGPGANQTLVYSGTAWTAAELSTDQLTDGTGSPLSGGKAAQAALVASGPTAGQALAWSGTVWTPTDISGVAGSVTATQVPTLNLLRGSVTAAQVPTLDQLDGSITATQLPAGVGTVTSGTGAPTSTPGDGSFYFDTSATPAHGYVRLSGAWKQFS